MHDFAILLYIYTYIHSIYYTAILLISSRSLLLMPVFLFTSLLDLSSSIVRTIPKFISISIAIVERSFVVVFCEETGRIVGEFNVNDLVDLFIHFWKFLTDPSYVERIGKALGDHVAPHFRSDLLQQGSQFIEMPQPSNTQLGDTTVPISETRELATDGRELTIESREQKCEIRDSSGRDSDGRDSVEMNHNYNVSSPAPLWSYITSPAPGFSHQTRWGPNDRRSVADADNSYNQLYSYSSSYSPRTSLSSQGATTTQSSHMIFGAYPNTLPDRLILAMFIIHHHRTVFLPLPPWFSVRLFEDPEMSISRFRRLKRIMEKRTRTEELHGEGYDPLADLAAPRRSNSKKSVSNNPDPTIHAPSSSLPLNTTDRSGKRTDSSRFSSIESRPRNFQRQGSDLSSLESTFESKCSSAQDDLAPRSHLLPPPWTSSLDFWRSE